jgi:hypothetical protein
MKDERRLVVDRPMAQRLVVQRLLALFGAGVLLFNFPLLRLWLSERTVFGLPLLPVALFGAWALLIALLAVLMERRSGPDGG